MRSRPSLVERWTTYTGQPVRRPMRIARLIASSSVQSGHVAGKSGGGERRRPPVVVLGADVQVAVDQSGQNVLAGRVDDAVGARQRGRLAEGHDPTTLDRDGRVDDFGRGDDMPTTDDDVDARRAHRWVSFSVTGMSNRP